MRCDELKEKLIDLLYEEGETPPANGGLQSHIASCPACRQELADLRAVRSVLRTWEDEAPLASAAVPRTSVALLGRSSGWSRRLRFAAIAAMIVLCFLALSNAELRWTRDGFSFGTHLFGARSPSDVYTKAEVREMLKLVVDDSEERILETNYLMLQRMMDTLEQERLSDMRRVREQVRRSGEKN